MTAGKKVIGHGTGLPPEGKTPSPGCRSARKNGEVTGKGSGGKGGSP